MERSLNNVTENIKRIQYNIADAAVKCGRNPDEIQLMAVTKTVPAHVVNHAIAQGIALLGENRAQELCDKYDAYCKNDVDIHFIGHLQTNKVKYVVDKVSMIHSVASVKLATEISRLCQKENRTMDILLEVNIGEESSKTGVPADAVEALAREIAVLKGVRIRGLMTIPPICHEKSALERYFAKMQALTVDIEGKNIDNITMDFLSMGMSDDFIYAIPYGANIVRVGSAIFGSR